MGAQYKLHIQSTRIARILEKIDRVITAPHCIKSLRLSDAYMSQWICHHWVRWWLVTCSAPIHYQNKWWHIVNWALGNKFQWNLNRNSTIYIHKNVFENVICKMAANLYWAQWVKRVDLMMNADTKVLIVNKKSSTVKLEPRSELWLSFVSFGENNDSFKLKQKSNFELT